MTDRDAVRKFLGTAVAEILNWAEVDSVEASIDDEGNGLLSIDLHNGRVLDTRFSRDLIAGVIAQEPLLDELRRLCEQGN